MMWQWKLLPLVMSLLISDTEACGSGSEKVLLKDVSALTLYPGEITTGRRSTGVPQLECTGGTAGCTYFSPQVVQCTNKGSDGVDSQWECKSVMDNAYRFGKIEVSCEGYDYPDDPYVLIGSCGLKYTLDFTRKRPGKFIIIVCVILLVILAYVIYKAYTVPANFPTRQQSYRGGDLSIWSSSSSLSETWTASGFGGTTRR